LFLDQRRPGAPTRQRAGQPLSNDSIEEKTFQAHRAGGPMLKQKKEPSRRRQIENGVKEWWRTLEAPAMVASSR
jgi:hypothetical protein